MLEYKEILGSFTMKYWNKRTISQSNELHKYFITCSTIKAWVNSECKPEQYRQVILSTSVENCVQNCFSCVWLFATLWTIACQTPLSLGFSRQEYWSGLPCPPPVDLPNPGIKPTSLKSLYWQACSLPLAPPRKRAGRGLFKFHLVCALQTLSDSPAHVWQGYFHSKLLS